MKLFVCIDNQNGMSFNGRHQSRDRVVIEQILDIIRDHTLCVAESSLHLFKGLSANIRVIIAPEEVLEDEYLFVESACTVPDPEHVEQMYVFRWNRDYPSDVKFPVKLFESKFTSLERTEFEGYSHAVIVLEVYSR